MTSSDRANPSAASPRLILASASPRRAELLRDAGFAYRQQPSPFDEAAADLAGLDVAGCVRTLAEAKARALADTLNSGLVLAADTLVSVDDVPLGKPADAVDARRMLDRLFAQPHRVLTAVCLIDLDAEGGRQPHTLTDTAEVIIAMPDAEDVQAYIASGEWQGKAGAYNLAELENRWRFTVYGDPATVVGLPMKRLTPLLQRLLDHNGQ